MAGNLPNLDHLQKWVGREEVAQDLVTQSLIDRFRATLPAWLYDTGDAAPLGLHWCLFAPNVPTDNLGPDGHGAHGEFLPPVPFKSRMWAGGQLQFHGAIHAGDSVVRTSRIASVVAKAGRSGPLVFVKVAHEYGVGAVRVITERQDLVFRPMQSKQLAAPAFIENGVEGSFTGDAVTLFRYSALTFNSHRIHYDYPYATQVEGYADLIVHGPLQATLLMNAMARDMGNPMVGLAYRGVSPLTANIPAALERRDGTYRLKKPDGTATFEAYPIPSETSQ
jgi:3-methylfumaryl-CoA hydratase